MTTLFDIDAHKGDIGGRKNEYLYGLEEHPNAPQQVGERRYTYSASGNPLTIEGGDVSRTLTWDAENRLRMMEDRRTGTLHLYTYNHAGERALKRYGTAQTVALNGLKAAMLLDVSENYSAYVSPYFTENNNRYTKHYYAGTMRLASKIGGAVYNGVDGEQDQSPDGSGAASGTESSEDLEPGSTYKAGTDEPDLYYYFTDHLGSTTYITDRKEVAQYVAYTPYGETFKEYRNVTPYKFNGKERDDETGYYYYGARYYDPTTTLWFGADPYAHKYPMNSPYVYCNANPVIYIDYNGEEGFSVTASARITIGPQMGFDIGNFVKAEVNIGSVDILGVSGTLGVDQYGVYPNGSYNVVGNNGLNWEQNASIGVGIPVFVETELSAKNIFAAKNGNVISDDKNTGVKLDVDMFKLSFDLKCIIGVEAEVNVNVIDGNTFKYIFNQLVDFFNNQIETNKNE